MMFPNLSVTEIVLPCSFDVDSKLAATRQRVEAVAQRASQTQALVERVRSEIAAVQLATQGESALYHLASDTIREHRAQEQRLEPDVLSVERQLETTRRAVETDTAAAEQQCRDMRVQITAAEGVAGRLRLSLQTISTSQQRMETLRDEADEMLDRLRAIARRQQPEQSA